MYFNEEDVKNKIITKYFEKLGFKIDDVEYETNLKIMIPRKGDMNIGEAISKNVFSDIVYKYNINGRMRNIFLVEVKRFDHKIVDRDIIQATCYAKLMIDIPPFCIITNGRDTILIDSITKENIVDIKTSNYVTSNYEITLDEDIRNEALKILVGLNSSNLIEFCKLQSISNLKDIMSIEKSTKSIIDETHCDRDKYLKDFEMFLTSSYRVYGLIGKSGYGKTNFIYSIWKKYKDTYPILFYNAGFLYRTLSESIEQDFHFMLNRNYDFYELIKKIDNIAKKNSKKIFIILDGLDESNNINEIKLELNELLKKTYNTNIYLILSCKINDDKYDIWYNFTHNKGSETVLGQSVFPSVYGKKINKLGTYMDKMDNNELKQLWESYRSVFKLDGKLRKGNKELSRQPFLLRIIAEVYQESDVENDSNEVELYKIWLEKKLITSTNFDLSKYILKLITERMIDTDNGKIKYDLAIDKIIHLVNALDILNELINLGIFNISFDKYQNKYINYSYENLFFYFYAYEIREWYKTDIIELSYDLESHFNSTRSKLLSVIFYVASKQRKFEKQKENWNQKSISIKNISCSQCTKMINNDADVSILFRMKIDNEKNSNLVCRCNVVHNECIPYEYLMYEAVDSEGYYRMTCSSILSIFKLNTFFRESSMEELVIIADNLKIEEKISKEKRIKNHENYKYLPTTKSVGQPFWVVMDFIGNTNTGYMYSQKHEGGEYILLFASKIEAELYIISNPLEGKVKYGTPCAVGVDKKCLNKLNEIYFSKCKDKKIIIHTGIRVDGQESGILLEFEQILKISESNMPFRDYVRKVNNS